MSWLVNITYLTHINYPVISIFLSSIRYGLQYLLVKQKLVSKTKVIIYSNNKNLT